MKVVQLTNGDYALPMRIEFLLTKRELVDALCWTVKDEDDPDDWPKLTARQVTAKIRTALKENGDALALWAEDEHLRRVEAIEAWASSLIEQTFGRAFERAALRSDHLEAPS